MKYSVDYVYENSFMKEWAPDPMIKTINEDGKEVSTGMPYRKANVPGTVVLITPKYEEGKGMQLKMTQEELNKNVLKMQIFTKDGKQITEAPLGTDNHDFWKNGHGSILINSGHADLDDELPKDAIVLAGMRKDKHFYIKGETAGPPVKSVVRWIITPIDSKHAPVVESEEQSMDAVKTLYAMDYQTQLFVAKIMGREMSEKTDPKIVEATLFRMITTEREQINSDGLTNIQKFIQLAKAGNDELNLEALANDAKRLFLKKSGIYYYGEIRMGKNMKEVVAKFRSDNDLLHEIHRIINKKK